MKNGLKKLQYVFDNTISLVIFFAVWELASRLELFVNPLFLPPFTKVISTLWGLILSGEIWINLIASLRRSGLGFVLGVAFSLPLGLAIGWFRRFATLINPLLQAFRNTPTLALLPVFIMFFGITEVSKVAVIFWGVMWSVLLNTIAGVRTVPPDLIRASRAMGAKSIRLFVTVIFPASLPHIFTGVRIAATTSILIVIAAEMLGANRGLGYRLNFNQGNMRFPEMYAYILVMAVLGVLLNNLLEYIEKRGFVWRG
ncbi:MAG: ABC transporter permease [Clostridiales bacterium]|jgi:NitT/TauT family transport system permease protein|nr:ABC transporter permease [Clostridiales bacterium]